MDTSLTCRDDRRREEVRKSDLVNGLDYLEVSADQLELTVYFLGKAPANITEKNVRISGGRRIRDIAATSVSPLTATGGASDDAIKIKLNKYGDFSTYTLTIVKLANDEPTLEPFENCDPQYSTLEFNFKIDCPTGLDCKTPTQCPPRTLTEPAINYLAKDYGTFRQLILDRLALILPDWNERHVPDLGIALIELLAYVGDYLSYYQDAVSTEAYLGTARQRISVRRHARLVDYNLHEGCNARVWACVDVDSTCEFPAGSVFFITRPNRDPTVNPAVLKYEDYLKLQQADIEIFEPVDRQTPIKFSKPRSNIAFYTWQERECCVPQGATSATLVGFPESRTLDLQKGDVLLFEEICGPKTGIPSDADPTHKHVVRLSSVTPSKDPLTGQPIVEIEWCADDALPFPLCVSSITDADHGCRYLESVSVGRGNVILVDHGFTILPFESIGDVPTVGSQATCDCEGTPSEVSLLPGKFRPSLGRQPLTFCQPLPSNTTSDACGPSAASMLSQDPRAAVPQIVVKSILIPSDGSVQWFPWGSVLQDPALANALVVSGFSQQTYPPASIPLSADLYKDYKACVEKASSLAPGSAIPGGQSTATTIQDHRSEYQATAELRDLLLGDLIEELLGRTYTWLPRVDLLESGPEDRHFVVENDNEGISWLRFGDNDCGKQPEAGSTFYASYRVGNGQRGNIGAESLSTIIFRNVTSNGGIGDVRNPLPAEGGAGRESMAEAKLFAPYAVKNVLQRAITADDYAALALTEFSGELQRAAAQIVWTGSWYEADVTLDPLGRECEQGPAQRDCAGGLSPSAHSMTGKVSRGLRKYRRIGHDLRVQCAAYVSLEIQMSVCVLPAFLQAHVKAALLDLFSNRVLPGGGLGFFHPDNLTFGGGIYLSKLVATAQGVPGVESVQVTRLRRQFEMDNHELENGLLTLGPTEIARVDNDPSFPEHGTITFSLQGGR